MKSYPKNKDNHTYNLTGLRFGYLVAVEPSGHDKWGVSLWLCQCDCGNKKIVNNRYLRLGQTKSCGCLRKTNSCNNGVKHGLSGTPEYNIWSQMISRCKNKNSPWFHRYGGRGIEVCDRWLNVENFFSDMGKRPTKNHSIDRIDNEKGYSKENCRWATKEQQANNTSKNKYITYNGETLTVSRMAKKYNLDIQLVFRRIYRGDRIEDIFGGRDAVV